jgi:hypothetical protein
MNEIHVKLIPKVTAHKSKNIGVMVYLKHQDH